LIRGETYNPPDSPVGERERPLLEATLKEKAECSLEGGDGEKRMPGGGMKNLWSGRKQGKGWNLQKRLSAR